MTMFLLLKNYMLEEINRVWLGRLSVLDIPYSKQNFKAFLLYHHLRQSGMGSAF